MITRWACLRCQGEVFETLGTPVDKVRCPHCRSRMLRAIAAEPSPVQYENEPATARAEDLGLTLLLEAQA